MNTVRFITIQNGTRKKKQGCSFFPENQLASIIVSHSLGVSKIEETSINIDGVDYDVRKFDITEHLNAEGHEELAVETLSDIKKVRTIWVRRVCDRKMD